MTGKLLRTALLLAAAPAGLMAALPAMAETHVEVANHTRTILWFQADEAKVNAVLPDGWTIASPAAGATAGGNAIILLIDALMSANAEGQAAANGATNRLAVLAVPVTHDATGAAQTMIVGGYVNDPAGSPAYYQNYQAGSVGLERTLSGGDTVEISESWSVSGPDGASLEIDLEWTRGTPSLARFDQVMVSATNPERVRFYRGHQGVDAIYSVPANISRAQVDYSVSGGLFGEVLDDATLIGVINLPWYYRDTFLP